VIGVITRRLQTLCQHFCKLAVIFNQEHSHSTPLAAG
jgi:hypothetical protein